MLPADAVEIGLGRRGARGNLSPMHCVVTAGPTCEPLDEVRRLTNFSTGRLGTELANFLADRAHEVTLLLSAQASWAGERRAKRVEPFATTRDLAASLEAHAGRAVDAVFHAAAVSDFAFGNVWRLSSDGGKTEVRAAKISTRDGALLAELVPTPKVLLRLRGWFPAARLVGWKYELDGDRASALRQAGRQIAEASTDACVVNGRAYGEGFGFVAGAGQPLHLADRWALFAALETWMRTRARGGSPPAGQA